MVYRKQNGAFALEGAAFSGGRFVATNAGFETHYHLTDHLGSVRAIVNGLGEVVERNDYYPFGMRWNDAAVQTSDNRYRYNGKENQDFVNVPYLDYGARMYDPRFSVRWNGPDLLAEKYCPISPYAFCANNPLKYIDPDGTDIWEINEYGVIINRIEDTSKDIFYMVDMWGTRVEKNSISFVYGTVESQKSYTYSPDGKTVNSYDVYQIRGDGNGTALFNFLADYVTGSFTEVEIGQIMTGMEGDKGLNFITTSHTPKTEAGIKRLLNGQLLYGYTVREINHSHPNNAYPSGLRNKKYDIELSSAISNFYQRKGLPVPVYHIYHVPSHSKILYSPTSTLSDFNLRLK